MTNGNVIEEIGANVRRQVISESTSNVIRQIMEYEVATAPAAASMPMCPATVSAASPALPNS